MIRIPQTVNVCEEQYVCWGRTEFGGYARDTEDVIFKLKNTDFDVDINGVACEVHECRVSALPFNRPWPGKQRPFDQSESAGFISFAADEDVQIKVKRGTHFKSAIVRPLSKKVKVGMIDGEVVFTLKEPGQYVLEFGDTHHALHIFFNEIKEYPEAENATIYFGPGMHFPGVISLRDNDVVYIDEEAIVFGSINSLGAKHVKICGGGILDNSCEERLTENCYENYTKGTFRIYNCEDIAVSDIILTNSSTWAMAMFNCSNIRIDNVKIVGHWRYNTDGIDIVNSENIFINNSFIRSFDDTISIKAIYDYSRPIQNIIVDNCVMWCGWGKNCEIGIETAAPEYRDITFKNCNLIHNSVGAMCISNGCQAEIHDILFENINVEFQCDTMYEVLQFEDGQAYENDGKTMPPCVIRNMVEPYRIRTKNPSGIVRKQCESVGEIHDVVYRNINIYTDRADTKPIINIGTIEGEKSIRNIWLENFYINGQKVSSFDSFDTDFVNGQNIVIN